MHPTPKLFIPRNPEKYVGNINKIVMRSSWEVKLAIRLDTDDNVLKWGSELKPIRYFSSVDGRYRRYYCDFWVLFKGEPENIKYMIEVKPYKQMIEPIYSGNNESYKRELSVYIKNQDKWKFAKGWAEENGFKFLVLNEYDLGIKKRK